jgi:peptidoglycan/xylan/chitin deacetylase (PgdA/CDA1 family)
MDHSRFAYSPIIDRKVLKWPNGARVAVWVVPNIEFFLFDKGGTGWSFKRPSLSPDVMNHSWRDYGPRVGIWRMMEVMEKYGVKGTVALNSDVCEHHARIIEAGNKLDWEWMGHGKTNSIHLTGMSEEDEHKHVSEVRNAITQGTGKAPRGWLGPGLDETFNTPDILAAVGFDYVGDWVNDDQPYPMKVKKNALISLPYSIEINDIPSFVDHHQSPDAFYQMIADTFDVLYEEGTQSGRVMAICLHPYLIGRPHRIKALDKALKYLKSHDGVWFAKGAEIVDWYKAQYLGK